MSNQERTGNILEDMHLMDADELRAEIKNLLEFNSYILTENWEEKEDLRNRLKAYHDLLKKGTNALENANDIVRPIHDSVIRWKLTSYALVVLCVYLCWIVYNGGTQ